MKQFWILEVAIRRIKNMMVCMSTCFQCTRRPVQILIFKQSKSEKSITVSVACVSVWYAWPLRRWNKKQSRIFLSLQEKNSTVLNLNSWSLTTWWGVSMFIITISYIYYSHGMCINKPSDTSLHSKISYSWCLMSLLMLPVHAETLLWIFKKCSHTYMYNMLTTTISAF